MSNNNLLSMVPQWSEWTKWERKFLWRPKKINGRWYWLRFVYERERLMLWYSQKYEYDYAFNVFDLIKKK